MKIGMFSINMGVGAQPGAIDRLAPAAEAVGFDSVWTGEHVVLPDPQAPPSPLPPEAAMLDPAVALAHAAAHTSTIKLGTGIIILPQRNPLVLAKELASVDVLSEGRLQFGVGLGYLGAEFDALGIPMEDRGARTVEYIEAMRAIWSMDSPEYHGRFVDYSAVQAHPRPVQQPGPPVHMGGHSAPAYRRAVTMCEGWYGYALTVEATEACMAGLAAAADEHERPPDLGDLEISVTPRGRVTPERVEAYAALGVERLILTPRGDTVDEWLAWIEATAGDLAPWT
ncbi:MAG: TIGR03619 family F420-dependent LLM class oxidoreductase [Actinomycetia bacterium]|nr:TIGR03619 family F420-dependent LLM class oxidoreductase [Actinomycetes bacterium]